MPADNFVGAVSLILRSALVFQLLGAAGRVEHGGWHSPRPSRPEMDSISMDAVKTALNCLPSPILRDINDGKRCRKRPSFSLLFNLGLRRSLFASPADSLPLDFASSHQLLRAKSRISPAACA
jgi:hypothetical protein